MYFHHLQKYRYEFIILLNIFLSRPDIESNKRMHIPTYMILTQNKPLPAINIHIT